MLDNENMWDKLLQIKTTGRVDFFLSYQTRAKTIGIEYDEIACVDLFEGNESREQIMIFKIGNFLK